MMHQPHEFMSTPQLHFSIQISGVKSWRRPGPGGPRPGQGQAEPGQSQGHPRRPQIHPGGSDQKNKRRTSQLLQNRRRPIQLRKSRSSAKPKPTPSISEIQNFDLSRGPVGRFGKPENSAEQNPIPNFRKTQNQHYKLFRKNFVQVACTNDRSVVYVCLVSELLARRFPLARLGPSYSKRRMCYVESYC
jgi:hypothetical protein